MSLPTESNKTAADSRSRANGAEYGPRELCACILSYDPKNKVAMDLGHALFIFSAALAKKPLKIVELGMGSGQVTQMLLSAIRYNGIGDLTVVDNFYDWDGKEPPHAAALVESGARLVITGEKDFLEAQEDHSIDFLVSDADHTAAHLHGDQYFRVVKEGGFIFFHDTNNPDFPNLREFPETFARCGYPFVELTARSRSDERTERGLCFVINQSAKPFEPGPFTGVKRLWNGLLSIFKR